MPKISLDILVRHTPDGKATPLKILWNDGREFEIDRIINTRKAAAMKCGGVGIRYLCRICGKEVPIFEEDGVWFIEK